MNVWIMYWCGVWWRQRIPAGGRKHHQRHPRLPWSYRSELPWLYILCVVQSHDYSRCKDAWNWPSDIDKVFLFVSDPLNWMDGAVWLTVFERLGWQIPFINVWTSLGGPKSMVSTVRGNADDLDMVNLHVFPRLLCSCVPWILVQNLL